MYAVEKIYEPCTIPQASQILAKDKDAKIIAGGTDILIKLRHKKIEGISLVDLSKIEALKKINRTENGDFEIGALVAFSELAEHELIKNHLQILRTAALSMGGPQIRNVATIGGNICNGVTSADSAPALFALKAQLQLESSKNIRKVNIEDFYISNSKVDLGHNEILTKFIIPSSPAGKAWAGHYTKFSVRKAMDISMLGCAAVCVIDPDGTIRDLRIALGTAAPTPIRCRETEKLAVNQKLSAELLAEIGNTAVSEANPRSSWRASKEYRQHLIRELTVQTVAEAYAKAGGVM